MLAILAAWHEADLRRPLGALEGRDAILHILTTEGSAVTRHLHDRMLEISYEAAWFVAMRIREAMRDGSLAPLGGAGKILEIDETFIGHKKGVQKKRGYTHKMAALALVELLLA